MPAVSQQQQKIMGLALSVKRGDTPRSEVSDDVLNIVDSMSEKDLEKYAGTEHTGLPKKVEAKIREMVRELYKEMQFVTEEKVEIEVDLFKNYNQRRPDKTIKVSASTSNRLSQLAKDLKPQLEKGGYDYAELHYGDKFLGSMMAGTDDYSFKKGRGLSGSGFKESVNEASRRATDFYGDSKHGNAIHTLLKGKWDSKKVEKYLDKVGGGNDVKNARIIDFISGDVGLNIRKYNTLNDQLPDLMKALETLYKDFLTESITEAKFNKGDLVRVVDRPKYVWDKQFWGKSGYIKGVMGKDILVTFPNGRTIVVDAKDIVLNTDESVNEAKSIADLVKDANRIKGELSLAQKEYSKSRTETNKAKVEAKKGQLERVANAIRNARADERE